MSTKKDIVNTNDIKTLVDSFYEKIKTDECIGFIFTDMAKTNWEKHLPIMYRFWENLLFYTGSYEGNPMELHQNLHRFSNLQPAYFDHWLALLLQQLINILMEKRLILQSKERIV
jgi:hemoglobin